MTPEPTFNADDETRPAPKLILDGVTHQGRVLSIAEWFAFKDRLVQQFEREAQELKAGAEQLSIETANAAQALRLEFLRTVFPKGAHDPIAEIEARGPIAIQKAYNAFFSHMRHAFGAIPPQSPESETPKKTDGIDSPASTTSEPNANANDSPTS